MFNSGNEVDVEDRCVINYLHSFVFLNSCSLHVFNTRTYKSAVFGKEGFRNGYNVDRIRIVFFPFHISYCYLV